MYRLISLATLIVCLLAVVPLGAQDCRNWSDWDLRGTYTAAGSGWINLAKEVDPGLPAGYSPQAFVQAFTFDGKGGGSGWISSNLGGVQFNAEVKWTYSMQPDCSVKGTHSFKIGGQWTAPNAVLWVISGHGQSGDLELRGIILGAGPGSSVPHATARRISMK